MRIGKVWRGVTAVAMVVAMTLAVGACGNKKDSGFGGGKEGSKSVTIGYINWPEDVAVTEVWKQLLEAKGYKVKTQSLDAAPLFSGVASGKLDFFMDAWLPNTHASYWKKFGSKMNDVGVWYQPADLGLAVPDYVKDVKTLADLKSHAGEFGGKITGIEASAGEMGLLKDKVIPAYGLKGTMKVVPSSTPAMQAALDKAYNAKKPIVVTLWRPHWAFSKYKIRYLTDPKKAWGQPDKIHTVASKQFAKNDAKAYGWLKNFKLTGDQLQGLEAQIEKTGDKNKDVAVKKWIKENKSLTDGWTK